MNGNGDHRPQLFSKEIEVAVLSAVLVLPNSADEYPIEPDDFYDLRHRHIWEAFLEIRDTHETPDPAGLIDVLVRNNKLEIVGGAAYITQIIGDFVTDQGLAHNVTALKNYRSRRLLAEQANWIAKNAYDLESDLGFVQDQVIMAMSGLQTHHHRSRHIRDVVSEVYADAEKAANSPDEVWGYRTGLIDFDKVMGGLHTSETIYLAGQPGVGKSILANQIGTQASSECPVWLCSLEMRDKRLVRRILSAQGEVNTRLISTGLMTVEDWTRLVQACENVRTKDIHIWDKRGMTLSQFRAEGARLVHQYGVKVIVLDYLYLLAGYDDKDMTPRTEILSKGVQTIAEQLDVSIIAVNSVVKEGMKGYSPNMADLRGSGQMLHDADTVVFISKKPTSSKTIETDLRIRELSFMKMRDGDMADGYKIQLGLTRGYPKFVNLGSDPEKPFYEERAEAIMEKFHE